MRTCSKNIYQTDFTRKNLVSLPMNEWMNDDYVKEILMDKKTTERGLFKKSELTNLFSKSNKMILTILTEKKYGWS